MSELDTTSSESAVMAESDNSSVSLSSSIELRTYRRDIPFRVNSLEAISVQLRILRCKEKDLDRDHENEIEDLENQIERVYPLRNGAAYRRRRRLLRQELRERIAELERVYWLKKRQIARRRRRLQEEAEGEELSTSRSGDYSTD